MIRRLSLRVVSMLALVATVAACNDAALAIDNDNNPDVDRVYGNPRDVETIVSKLYQQMYNGLYGSSDNLWTQSMVMAFESSSQLGNFGMGVRGGIPRSPIDNGIGNGVNVGNLRDFSQMTRNGRSAANAVAKTNEFIAAGRSAGSAARDARNKAFGFFGMGYALGYLSLFYDSAAVITHRTPRDSIPDFSGYATVNEAALEMLDSALVQADAAGTQVIPKDWISGTTDMSMADFKRLVRSFRARFRAGVARTPEERAAVNWDAVITDTENGITADWVVRADVSAGWSGSVMNQLAVSTGWSQMTPFYLGMGDTTGAYQAWAATPLTSRAPFLMRTPDQRFPSGETREAQNTASGGNARSGPPAGSILYFRNRPSGEDTPAEPWGTWYYDNHRFWSIRAGGGNGPFIVFTKAENDLLGAEGHIRKGNASAAAALIDRTRVRAGLPATEGMSLTSTVPGGNACVPRLPNGQCGNLMEAMKWEKRLETAFTGYGQWFIDARGWGDLVQGTALEWPVPYQELQPRVKPIYMNSRVAAVGTYGF